MAAHSRYSSAVSGAQDGAYSNAGVCLYMLIAALLFGLLYPLVVLHTLQRDSECAPPPPPPRPCGCRRRTACRGGRGVTRGAVLRRYWRGHRKRQGSASMRGRRKSVLQRCALRPSPPARWRGADAGWGVGAAVQAEARQVDLEEPGTAPPAARPPRHLRAEPQACRCRVRSGWMARWSAGSR